MSTAFTPPPTGSHTGPATFSPPPLDSHAGPADAASQPKSLVEKFDDLSQGAGDAGAHFTLGAYEMFRKAAKAIGFDKLPEPSEALRKAGETPENASAWRKWGRRIEEIAPYFATGSSMLGAAAVAGAQSEGDPTAMGAAAAGAGVVKALPAIAKVASNPEVQQAVARVIPKGKEALDLLNKIRGSLPGAAKAATATEAAVPASKIIPGEAPPVARSDFRQAIIDELNSQSPSPPPSEIPTSNPPAPAPEVPAEPSPVARGTASSTGILTPALTPPLTPSLTPPPASGVSGLERLGGATPPAGLPPAPPPGLTAAPASPRPGLTAPPPIPEAIRPQPVISQASPQPGAPQSPVPVAAPSPLPAIPKPGVEPPPSPATPMTGKTTSNPYEVAARAEKARGLAQFLYQNGEGISSKDVLNMTPEHWDMAAKGAATQFPEQWPNGMVKPSPQTRRLAIVELKKMEKSAPIAKQLSEKMASPDDVHAYAVAKGIDDSAAQQEFATSGYKIQ